MIPHTVPPFWPDDLRPGRFAAAILRASNDLLDLPDPWIEVRKCRVGLLGIPDDTGIELNSGRVGAREGPKAFRLALARYGAAIPADDHPPFPRIFDAGDIVPGDTLEETHGRVTEAVLVLLEHGLFPICIGGGHDLTYPHIRAVARVHGPLSGLNIDAHLDVREEVGSGMPFRRLIEDRLVTHLHILGLDPLANSHEHLDYFLRSGGRVVDAHAIARDPSSEFMRLSDASRSGLFVTLDLDVIDASHAPGVSAMNPCGLSPCVVGRILEAAGASHRVKCFDMMELSPPHDESGRTTRLAAHLFLKFLRGLSVRFDHEDRVQ